MDPVSQGLVGSALPQSFSNKNEIRLVALIGFLAGLLADIDIVIRSSSDQLLFLDYHRQFTHSIIFIPAGGLIAAVFLWLLLKKRLSFRKIYFYAVLGYGTHCFLDACTNYGTQLLWPFSDARIAWNNISITDPLFTVPLIVLLLIAVFRKSVFTARIALIFAVLYLLFGLYQKEQARQLVLELAQERGHKPERVLVHPSIGNLVLWRSVYESDGIYYVQALRVTPLSEPKIYEGDSIKAFNPKEELKGLDSNSVLSSDIERFSKFARGYLIVHPDYPDMIGDLRMGILPESITPLWGIKIDTDNQNRHILMENYDRSIDSAKIQRFISMLLGRN